MPRITSSTGTPACDARNSARVSGPSIIELSFMRMCPGRPSSCPAVTHSIWSIIWSRRCSGATSAVRYRGACEKPVR